MVSLWTLSMIIFALVRSSGNPAELLYEYPGARQEDIDRQAAAWGLDKPWRGVEACHMYSRASYSDEKQAVALNCYPFSESSKTQW